MNGRPAKMSDEPDTNASDHTGVGDAPGSAYTSPVKEEDEQDVVFRHQDVLNAPQANGPGREDTCRPEDACRASPAQSLQLQPSEANPKKRKRTDTPKSRAVSPPWKMPTVEGPTTFTQEGKRRSARTNELPIDLKPGADKRRHTRAEHHRAQEKQDARNSRVSDNRIKGSVASRTLRGTPTDVTFKTPAPKAQAKPQSQPHAQTDRRHIRRSLGVEPSSPMLVRAHSNSQTTYGKRHRYIDMPSSPESTHRRSKSGTTVEKHTLLGKHASKPQVMPTIVTSPPSSGFKLKLRGLREANREPPRTLNPLHIPKTARHTSFASFIEQDNVWEGEDEGAVTGKEAIRRARSINRLIKESKPGGLLSEERSIILSQPQKSDEPPEAYGHWQHVVAQALNFRQLLFREVRQHQESARKIANAAHWALDSDRRFARFKPRISREEWEAQQFGYQKKRYQQVVRDVQGSWALARKEVLRKLEMEQEAKRQTEGRKALDSMLDQSTALLNERRRGASTSLASDDDDYNDRDYESFNEPLSRDVSTSRGPSRMSIVSTPISPTVDKDMVSLGAETDPENMSSSDDDEEELDVNPDADLTIDELRAKYQALPEQRADIETVDDSDDTDEDEQTDEDEDQERSHREGSIDPANVALDDVDSALEEEEAKASGSETESDPGQESTEVSDDDGASDSGEEEDGTNGMLGFFGKNIVAKLKEERQKADDHMSPLEDQKDETTAIRAIKKEFDSATGPIQSGDQEDDKTLESLPPQDPQDSQPRSLQTITRKHDQSMSDGVTAAATLAGTVEGGVPTPAATSIADADTPTADAARGDASTPADTGDEDGQTSKDLVAETDVTSRSETPKNVAGRSDSPYSTSRPLTPKSGHLGGIDVSLLLRGKLREYQQNGLDWLAGLYSHGSNGILADEMGLGKTIQTIALFAHLAIHQKEWGPHLVVVPTSVMLNWEMEFKKFLPGFKVLTYYGSIAERKKLRFGWLNNDKWNVVITSYQLIVQDKQAFKKRPWHYLVLDEAHQIKNWQTQKWQSMLNMNTQARLLLTGTPLQNNLSELWSLFFFLMPSEGIGGQGFAELEQFQQAMKRPADQILNQGKQILDEQARSQVKKLHEVLRPYLLRRLKADVEKQMPGKYEHVVYCKLSKRQRQLYDAFLGRADTRATLLGGNYVGVMHVLMELRKVCNHPDLFEERMVRTSFCMPRSVVAAYEPTDLLIRKRLLASDEESINLKYLGLDFVHKEHSSKQISWKVEYLQANRPMADLIERATRRLSTVPSLNDSTIKSTNLALHHSANAESLESLIACRQTNVRRTSAMQRPVYGSSMRGLLSIDRREQPFPHPAMIRTFDKRDHALHFPSFRMNRVAFSMSDLQMSLSKRSQQVNSLIEKFSIATPNVVAHDVLELTLGHVGMRAAEAARAEYLRTAAIISPTPSLLAKPPVAFCPVGGLEATPDPFHEARIRQTIAFPDKRLLQYDCGKLQKLATLLRDLQAGGHRALIFTQMSRVLDILEVFLNFHGYRYLRLDGTTKVEHRQLLTEKYNSDPRILVFILSSRSGGLGINLTGADSVIFYDLDWNPAMDKQCQDRAHRIGQTRDVHIYKFVSEYTIEANILRKSNQKRLLDDVIIQKGEFTTDYFNRVTHKDALEGMLEENEASKAMDMVLGDDRQINTVLQSVEEKDDATAAVAATKEAHDVEAEDEKEMGDEEPVDGDDASKTALRAGEDPAGEKGRIDDFMFETLYRELVPQADMLFKVKARDKVAARRAKDRHRVR